MWHLCCLTLSCCSRCCRTNCYIHFLWTKRIINAGALTMLLETAWVGYLNMADIAQGALFIVACGSLYGLAVYLFRDQIWPGKISSTD